MNIDKNQIEIIVEKVLQELSVSKQSQAATDLGTRGDGVFQEMEDAIQAAVVAHQQLVQLPLDVREKIIQSIRNVGWANREEYGRMELEETDLGAVAGTVQSPARC
jgi:propionaldehyde dehydrogenase